MNTIICIRKINRYMEGKLVKRFGNRRSKIQVNKRIFINIKKFERGNKELVKVAKLRKNRTERKENGRICIEISKNR